MTAAKTPVTSFFSLKTQFENLGDALINRDLVELAAQNGPVCVDLSRCPPEFRETLNLEALGDVRVFTSTASLFSEIVRHRLSGKPAAWFISPGGYFGEISMGEALKRTPNAIVLGLMRLIGVRILHVGVSYERLGQRHLKFLKWRAPVLSRHVLRDSKSQAYITELGLRSDGVMPDLAFTLFEKGPRPEPVAKTDRIGLCFRTEQTPEQIDEIKTFLRWAVPQLPDTTKFRLVVQVMRDGPGAEIIADFLMQELGRVAEIVTCYDSLSDCQKAYADCDMVIGNRLHGLLIGASENQHLLACVRGTENGKIRGLFDELGLNDQVIELDRPLTEADSVALQKARDTAFDGQPVARKLSAQFREILTGA